jgi:hypothetical protein
MRTMRSGRSPLLPKPSKRGSAASINWTRSIGLPFLSTFRLLLRLQRLHRPLRRLFLRYRRLLQALWCYQLPLLQLIPLQVRLSPPSAPLRTHPLARLHLLLLGLQSLAPRLCRLRPLRRRLRPRQRGSAPRLSVSFRPARPFVRGRSTLRLHAPRLARLPADLLTNTGIGFTTPSHLQRTLLPCICLTLLLLPASMRLQQPLILIH